MEDKPRRLTTKEIKSITDHCPSNSIIECMTNTLKEIEICPSEIPELKEKIIEGYRKSLINSIIIGIQTAESVAINVTQLELNSFHKSDQLGIYGPVTTELELNSFHMAGQILSRPNSQLRRYLRGA